MNREIAIPFGDSTLVLSREQFDEARVRGQELMYPPTTPSGGTTIEILDAPAMAKRTGIPASWWLAQARRKMIPHIGAGKYVRFELAKVLEHLTIEPRHADSLSVAAPRDPTDQPVTRGRYHSATKKARN